MIAVIFDLDGTLIDSAPDIQAAANVVLTGEGAEALDLPTVVSFVGNGLPTFLRRAMAARGLPEADHPRLLAAMLHLYETATSLTRVYPGAIEALEALEAAGHPLGICTNKPETPARAVLRDLGLARFFACVVGGDTLPVVKPDAAPFHACLAGLGGGAAVFVGDSEVDAETAVAARVPFLLFTEGYRKSPIEQLPHTGRYSDFAALPGLIAQLGRA